MKRTARFLIIITVLLAISGFYISNQKKYADEADGWNLILVNEEYYIPEGYTVELTTLHNGERVDKRIYPELQKMFDAARDCKWRICVVATD